MIVDELDWPRTDECKEDRPESMWFGPDWSDFECVFRILCCNIAQKIKQAKWAVRNRVTNVSPCPRLAQWQTVAVVCVERKLWPKAGDPNNRNDVSTGRLNLLNEVGEAWPLKA